MTESRSRRVRPVGDAALLLDWPAESDALANRKARSVQAQLLRLRPAGLVDAVVAARTLLVKFDPLVFDCEGFQRQSAFWEIHFAALPPPRRHEIPVWYGGPAGVDLEELAVERGISARRFVELHSAATYTVAFLGFTPGFPYLTGLPETLAARRRETPRTQVPAGSVAIGGSYAGIYPSSTPGGWRLIGRTPLEIFDPSRESPALLAPGDIVRFTTIPGDRFAAMAAQAKLSRR